MSTCRSRDLRSSRPFRRRSTGTYVNPVLDADFPDPAVIHAPDGYYYAYATQTLRDGEWINIQVARSADLVHWEHLGDALPEKPDWAQETQDFWAPYVLCDGAALLHVLFGDATTSATSPSAAIASPSRRRIRRPGRSSTWACRCCSAWASNISTRWRSTTRRPASACSIGDRASSRSRCRSWPTTGCRSLPDSEPIDLVWPNPVKGAFPRLVEAAWVIRHEDFYYLFYSGDNCCGPDAEYGVMVARSREPDRPVRDARGGARRAAQPDAVQERALARARAQFDRHRQGRRRTGSSITRST